MATEIISIETDRQRLRIAPELGGALAGWDWKRAGSGWTPIFRPWDGSSEDPYALACFPLVPWCGAVSNRGFEYDGAFYPLSAPHARGEQAVPVDGDGRMQAWQLASRMDDRIKLALESKEFNGNPYHYLSTQTFLLLPDGLQIDLTVTNMGRKTLPFGLGIRPSFPRDEHTLLQSRAEGVWLTDDAGLPARHVTRLPASWDYKVSASLNGPSIDNCFTGWNGRAMIDYPDRGLHIALTMPDCNGYHMLNSPSNARYFVFGPVTHPVDAFHLPEQPGLAYLDHGDSLALRTKFLVRESGK